jgi:polysaccharide deacetylase family protein (PEP-CTERM system associated)
MGLKNAFTIDVEDYFQVSAFEHAISPADWPNQEVRLEATMERLLLLLEEFSVKGTFFTLGWVAERYPDMIKGIVKAGHELASHGYWHQRATVQTPQVFRDDVGKTRKLLQDLTGASINGYRAPSFSIDKSNDWVYDVLLEEGYSYSSSIYPVVHDHYGVPDAPRFKYKTQQGLWELPLSTLTAGDKNIPISGGGYFRLYPYALTALAIKRYQM